MKLIRIIIAFCAVILLSRLCFAEECQVSYGGDFKSLSKAVDYIAKAPLNYQTISVYHDKRAYPNEVRVIMIYDCGDVDNVKLLGRGTR